MWLINSSIGRKVVMSVTGLALVLFLLFHASMNITLLFSLPAYNWICEMLGANWYALVGTMGLAALAVLHILYAFILTVQNYRARGNDRYAVTARQKDVEWAGKNMLVLGFIILVGIGIHLAGFWFKMQFAELVPAVADKMGPSNGAARVIYTFSCPCMCVVYLLWLVAIWYHLTHGIWSGLTTLGWSGNTWMPRIKCIGNIVATLIVAMFAAVVVVFGVKYHKVVKTPCDAVKIVACEEFKAHNPEFHGPCPIEMGVCPEEAAKMVLPEGPCHKGGCMKAEPCHKGGCAEKPCEKKCEKPCEKGGCEKGGCAAEKPECGHCPVK